VVTHAGGPTNQQALENYSFFKSTDYSMGTTATLDFGWRERICLQTALSMMQV
jgi:hypothetical protein